MARRVLQLDLEQVRMLPILVVLDRLVAAKEEAASLMAGEKDILKGVIEQLGREVGEGKKDEL